MSEHRSFILTSIESLIEDAVSASRGIVDGISSFAISEYIYQTLFIQMTGFQEQKSKCICWELGTTDYEFRRNYLENHTHYGEMSTYESKKYVYESMIKIASKKYRNFNIDTVIDKEEVVNSVKDAIIRLFTDSPLTNSNDRHYREFIKSYDEVFKKDCFATRSDKGKHLLLAGTLMNVYQRLYDYRNRCAHNVISYQQNLPAFHTIAHADFKYENYYYRYAILMLIDILYIRLYEAIYNVA